jgi:hypothetical protein
MPVESPREKQAPLAHFNLKRSPLFHMGLYLLASSSTLIEQPLEHHAHAAVACLALLSLTWIFVDHPCLS